MASLYEQLGVDPGKANVREIFSRVVNNEYPGAFVNIITDPFCKDRRVTMHMDGDGSKIVQRLLRYYETGDQNSFLGMVDDALAMNTGDIAAAGFVKQPWIITDVINTALPKELKELLMISVARRMTELREIYKGYGFEQNYFLGGETADLKDNVRTGVFDMAIMAWAQKSEIIIGNVKPGDVIWGCQSDGKAVWEEKFNSGIMSNGLTLARSCLMHADYNQKYPQLKRDGEFYKGKFKIGDYSYSDLGNLMSVSEAILSPTRQWAIVIRKIIDTILKYDPFARKYLHGITMNTGGGATKIMHIGKGGIRYKKIMPPPPPLFQLIQRESGETWQDMYKDFNCGVGIDIIGDPCFNWERVLLHVGNDLGLEFFELGACEESEGKNEVLLQTEFGQFHY